MQKTVLLVSSVVCAFAVPLAAQTELNRTPSRVVGQNELRVSSTNPNLPEGREFFSPWAVVVDTTADPPALYVSDTFNHRVLGWRNAASFSNGQEADIVIGQLDKFSTQPLGPGTSRSSGMNDPGALAVDARGNLYVVDTRNNRILRFPRPFSVPADELKVPDMVLGQQSFTSNAANAGGRSASTVATGTASVLGRSGLAFDAQGNLWFSDPLNNRVLRYPASAIEQGRSGASAELVLGQLSFDTADVAPATAAGRLLKDKLRSPSGLAFDSAGRLFVVDGLSRVLVFVPPFVSGMAASRIMGVYVLPQGTTPPPANEYTLAGPESVVTIGDVPLVVDAGANRILRYDPFDQWPAESTSQISPPARAVIGQESFGAIRANRGQAEPSAASLRTPLSAFHARNELYVADADNHRVLVFPSVNTGTSAVRVLGQEAFNFGAPNRIEGKELFLFNGFSTFTGAGGRFADGGGIAIDTRSAPPRLYVADTFNHRVLGYRDARVVRPGDAADLVIGQNDFKRNLVNAPQNEADVRTESGLFLPVGLAVDSDGNLWVADSGNGRVLRFPSPFNQPQTGERLRATLVLGQQNFTSKITDATSRTMARPFGVALTLEGDLLVSDAIHQRVLLFRRPAGGDFTSGQAADTAIGQPDFFSSGLTRNAPNRFFSPRHIATDTDNRLYVADAGNNRVLIFDRIVTAGNDPSPAVTLTQLNSPHAIFVSSLTGEIWVGEPSQGRALRFPRFEQLALNPQSDYQVAASGPLALAQDQFGNLFVDETINRVAMFFNGMAIQNGANFNDQRPVAPGMILSIYPRGQAVTFSEDIKVFEALPLPRDLNDIQVLIDDRPAPLYFVSPRQINVLTPMGLATGGTAEFLVVRKSVGQILAAGTLQLGAVSPALFTMTQNGSGQIAALNEDNSVNSTDNRIKRNQVIQVFGTGQGFIADAPPDGEAPSGPVSLNDGTLRVLVGTDFVPPENILYSGLAPGLVGVWQINVRIPERIVPAAQVPFVVTLQSIPSNRGPGNRVLQTFIAVDQ
ncbi:MAG: hypothetical protein HYZ57_05250 [Acidobacteria bacterium]|nr:hypothetical protein [Acidobacteriota bacterium]